LKICIVTPDIVGPQKNGGIGTHCYNLFKLLTGHDCTLLFTENSAPGAPPDWHKSYTQNGIRVITADSLPINDPWHAQAPYEEPFLKKSRRIAEYLSQENFDLVHFQDWKANGFHAIRLRRTGIALQNTRLLLTLHSPSRWIRQGMEHLSEDPIAGLKLDFAERYCCENADLLIAPSQHMLDWADAEGWRIKAKTKVMHYPYRVEPSLLTAAPIDRQHIIFFGRLETRKGLGIFLQGLGHYLTNTKDCPVREVSFLGKPDRHAGQPAEAVIDNFAQAHPKLILHREFERDTHEALNYLRQTGGVAFLPSLLDNCPFAIIECIEQGIPFMAARSGGIPEIVHSAQLFEASTKGVIAALASIPNQHWNKTHPYCADRSNQAWADLHQSPPVNPGKPPRAPDKLLVSICITYYELPDYLPQAIHQQSYPNLEVIVCDDGSHSDIAKAIFEQEETRYSGPNWHFIRQANQGVSAARNSAAAQATGTYLVFMDADNYARAEMIECMVTAMETAKADALTCEFTAFYKSTAPSQDTPAKYVYRPLGAALPIGLLENTFGDANAIIKSTTFQAVGGFKNQQLSAYADWDLFLRIYLSGGDVDVIPKALFWYRHRTGSMLRRANHSTEAQIIIASALREHPQCGIALATTCTLPLFEHYKSLEKNLGHGQLQALKKLRAPWHKKIYRSYRRLLGDPRYQKS
jgi:glycosyltransferase involved in cell wall biosynthesis